MKYDHLVKKISELQSKIDKAVISSEEHGLQDGDTHAKMVAADAWVEDALKTKLGEAEVPAMAGDITPMVAFSDHLYTYQNAFDKHTQSLIEEYREYVQDLFQRVEEASVPRA